MKKLLAITLLVVFCVSAVRTPYMVYPTMVLTSGPSTSAPGGNFPGGLQYSIASTVDRGEESLLIFFSRDCRNLVIQTGVSWPDTIRVEVAFYNDWYEVGIVQQLITGSSEAGVNFKRTFDMIEIINSSPAGDATLAITGAYCNR
jgi:hypothetical protein